MNKYPFTKTSTEESLDLLANKLREAEAQEAKGEMRNFDDFVDEMKKKYSEKISKI